MTQGTDPHSCCALEVDPNETRMALGGELTVAEAQELHTQAIRCVTLGKPIRVDLANVTYVDAAILQLLAATRRAAVSAHVPFVVQHAAPSLINDAELLGLGAVLTEGAETP